MINLEGKLLKLTGKHLHSCFLEAFKWNYRIVLSAVRRLIMGRAGGE